MEERSGSNGKREHEYDISGEQGGCVEGGEGGATRVPTPRDPSTARFVDCPESTDM